jgi:hypothetical protein
MKRQTVTKTVKRQRAGHQGESLKKRTVSRLPPMKHAGTVFPRADKARAAARYELSKRPERVAVDLGTTTCGIAALYRRYDYNSYGERYGYHTVTASAVPIADLRATLAKLRPHVVVAEEPARGYREHLAKAAVKTLSQACAAIGATLYRANVSTWKKEAFGTGHLSMETIRDAALQRLRGLRVEHVDALYEATAKDRDAVAALRLLACWVPVGISLRSGNSKTVITTELTQAPATKSGKHPPRVSAGAWRLLGVLYEAAVTHSQPGIIKQCRAAHIAYGNYRRFLGELSELGWVQVTGVGEIKRIHLPLPRRRTDVSR